MQTVMQEAKSNVVIAPTFWHNEQVNCVITAAIALSFNNAGKHFSHCLLSMQRGPTALGSKDKKLLVHCYRFGASG